MVWEVWDDCGILLLTRESVSKEFDFRHCAETGWGFGLRWEGGLKVSLGGSLAAVAGGPSDQ